MPSQLNLALLIPGAVLLLAALFAVTVLGSAARSPAALAIRALAGLAGAALLFFGAQPYFSTPRAVPPTSLAPAPVSSPPTTSLPGEPGRAATAALEDCALPSAPEIPDGSKAKREEMVAARAAFVEYDKATNAYAACVDAAIDRISKQFPDATDVDKQTLRVLGTGAHNTAIDQEQAVADRMNAQVREFKAKHPGQ